MRVNKRKRLEESKKKKKHLYRRSREVRACTTENFRKPYIRPYIRKKKSRGDAGAAWDGGGCVQSVQSDRSVAGRGNARTQCFLPPNAVETRNRPCFVYGRECRLCTAARNANKSGEQTRIGSRRHGRHGRCQSEHEKRAHELDIWYSTSTHSRRKPFRRQAQQYITRAYKYCKLASYILDASLPHIIDASPPLLVDASPPHRVDASPPHMSMLLHR
jgi:hypothetical protein